MGYRVRDATVRDAPRLAALHVQTFQETHGSGPGVSFRREQWERLPANDQGNPRQRESARLTRR
jgi:hypothetical protein